MNSTAENYISISEISKSFGDFKALNNVSLTVGLGERVVVCGPSGSGKSTLIRCINGLEQHETGSIMVDGIALNHKTKSMEQIRSLVGMVFQQFNLFPHLTVLENLTLGPVRSKNMTAQAAKEIAMTYLERVKIPEQAGKYPRQLSGGQQQRVAIARAWALAPEVLFLDEPTASLDPAATRAVEDIISSIHKAGTKVVLTTQNLGQARRLADEVLFMFNGRLLEQTPADRFFHAPETSEARAFIEGEF